MLNVDRYIEETDRMSTDDHIESTLIFESTVTIDVSIAHVQRLSIFTVILRYQKQMENRKFQVIDTKSFSSSHHKNIHTHI
jgi:hypothetical protein